MKAILRSVAAFIAPIIVFAESSVERELSGGWDSMRFALGVLETDYYMERPVIVLHKTGDGGILMICSAKSSSSRTLNEAQVKSVVSRIADFFDGAGTPPPSGAEFQRPAFFMKLAIDDAFDRKSFFKNPSTKHDAALISDFHKFLSSLSDMK